MHDHLDHRYSCAVHRGEAHYPRSAPFDADVGYPELRGPVAFESNPAFDSVRAALQLLLPPGEAHGHGSHWNPLGRLVEPGQTVFIKPNLVDHEHRFGGDVWSVITHPSVVRAVAEYVAIALRGEGRIIVGDNPHVDCNWEALSSLYRMDLVGERIGDVYGVEFDFVDLRSWHTPDLSTYGWRDGREPLDGDPHGDHVVTRQTSYLDGAPWWLFRGTLNERLETIRSHHGGHSYHFSKTMAEADTFISVPKLKSHAKVGVTLNLKGLIGTITNKNSLVHWTIGYPRFGGDEYPDPDDWTDYPKLYWQHLVTDLVPSRVQLAARDRFAQTRLGAAYSRMTTTEAQEQRLLRGAWDGNDTTWRMTADVHDSFIGDPGQPKRRTFSIIDGLIGGDTDGPHFPHRVESGTIIAGHDLLTTDLVATRFMDFDPEHIAYLRTLSDAHGVDIDAIEVRGISGNVFDQDRRYLEFRPPNRWPNLSLAGLAPAGDLLDEARRERLSA